MSSLRDLYQEIIIDHGKTPRNFGKLPDASYCKCGHNPLCGDQLTLSARLNSNDEIEDIRFEGHGCAISVASASLMTEAVKGKTLSHMEKLFEQFHQLVTTGESHANTALLGKLAVFSGVCEFPIRVKCATLAWHTLRAAFVDKDDRKPVSTE